jgi:pimeloyl-ACP methyl ester carboxylesterase
VSDASLRIRSSARRRLGLYLYLFLLLASQVWTATRPDEAPYVPKGSERTTLPSSQVELSALRWHPQTPAQGKLPVVLLHGSPGAASDMTDLAERLALDGREILSLDLPGFGGSVSVGGGRSIEAHARATLAALPWKEFHVAAWSMGGGVALHMARLAPARVRSLSLIASIGVQEGEGSGSYVFEHVKYALMWTLLVPGGELIPHFGVLGPRSLRVGFCRNFWESDQRPLREILSSLETPLLIAHGRRDFLVPLWCAEESHALARSSRLVIFQGSHFLLFPPPDGQLDLLGPELEAFLARHDVPGVVEPRALVDSSTAQKSSLPEPYELPRRVPWWIGFAVCAGLARWRAGACGLVVGVLAALLQLDLGVGLVAGLLGASWRALCTREGTWKRWLLDHARLIGGTIAGSVFVGWAGAYLCEFAGAWGGSLIALALPLCALVIGELAWRRIRRPAPAA